MDNLKTEGLVGQRFSFRKDLGIVAKAIMSHQSSFWSSEKMKPWPYP